jgi:hypothetical protein
MRAILRENPDGHFQPICKNFYCALARPATACECRIEREKKAKLSECVVKPKSFS